MGMRKFWSVALPFSKVACVVINKVDIGSKDRAETNSAYIKYIYTISGAYILDKQ